MDCNNISDMTRQKQRAGTAGAMYYIQVVNADLRREKALFPDWIKTGTNNFDLDILCM